MRLEDFERIFSKILRFIINRKFWAVTIFFLLNWVFFDSNNLIEYIKIKRHNRALMKEKQQLIEKIRRDSARLVQLKTDDETFERFVRETFYFHKPNEDVYVIKEKN